MKLIMMISSQHLMKVRSYFYPLSAQQRCAKHGIVAEHDIGDDAGPEVGTDEEEDADMDDSEMEDDDDIDDDKKYDKHKQYLFKG